MTNWAPLRRLLADSEPPLVLSWQELDDLVGGMPPSARNHAAYWSGNRSQWRGFKASTRVGTSVTFTRVIDSSTPSNRPAPQATSGTDMILVSAPPGTAASPVGTNAGLNVTELVEALTNEHNRLALVDFVARKDPRMDSPGLYSWWVDATGAADVSRGLGSTVEPGLVYAGQAGAASSRAQKASTNTLWKRVAKMHLGRRHKSSTLRRTLGSILAEAHGEPGIDESALTHWMLEHLQVVAIPVTDAMTLSTVEVDILARLNPPLNLKDVERTALRSQLKALRKKHTRIATEITEITPRESSSTPAASPRRST